MSHFLNLSILLASALLLMAAREGQALKCYQQPWMVNIIRQSTLHQHTNSSGEEFIKNSLADLLAGEMLSDKCPAEAADQRCFVATECQVPTHKKILANAFGVRVPDDVLMAEFRGCIHPGPFNLADTGLPAEYHETLAKLLHAGLVANTTADNFCERQKAYFGCAQCHLCEDDLCNGLVGAEL